MGSTTKWHLMEATAEASGYTQIECGAVIREFLRMVSDHVAAGHSIEIRGFGTFYSKVRQARPARNPRTGELVPLPRRRVPLLRFSADFKHILTAAKAKGGP